jgi:hypothetical protein
MSTLGALLVTVTAPDGTRLLEQWAIAAGGGFVDPMPAAISGTYWIRLHPITSTTGSVPVTLFDVPPDISGSIVPGGAPVTVAPGVPGQRALLGFTGTSGGRISLRVTGDTIASSRVQIKTPTGASFASRSAVTTAGTFIDAKALSLSGAYRLLVDPNLDVTGQMTLALYAVPPDVTGALAVNGAGRAVTLAVPGQNANLTFSAASGQHVTARLTADSIASAYLSILRPDGTSLSGPVKLGTKGGTLAVTLPAAGIYTIALDPITWHTGVATVAVTSP